MIAAAVVAVLALASVTETAADTCTEALPELLETSQFACGLSAASESSATSPPTLYCSTASAEIRDNRQVNPGGATKPCYFLLRPEPDGMVLNLPPSLMTFASYTAATRVQLHKSVSVLVGSDKSLVLKGQAIASVNPEIFSDIGDTQKRRLKTLALVNTSVESLDASLLRNLNISVLVLAHNAKLTQFTNFQDVRLPALKELHLWRYNTELMDCRSFKSLPSSITKMFVFPNSTDTLGNEAAGCAFCSLPKSVSEVVVSEEVKGLPQHPNATSSPCSPQPYPMPQQDRVPANFLFPPTPCKSFNVSASSATGCATGCSTGCAKFTTTTTAAPSTTGIGAASALGSIPWLLAASTAAVLRGCGVMVGG